MIVYERLIWEIVADKFGIFARCESPHFVTPKRNALMNPAIGVSVPSGARQQMQTPVTLATDVRAVLSLGMNAAPLTQISGPYEPNAAEIGIE